jgi:hypothetical protein
MNMAYMSRDYVSVNLGIKQPQAITYITNGVKTNAITNSELLNIST